jgi:hypothetical protein
MPSIRSQLDQAKHEYHLAAYPGDLASDVLSLRIGPSTGAPPMPAFQTPGSRNRWWWAGTGSAAAAAVVAFGFYLSQRGPATNNSLQPAPLQPLVSSSPNPLSAFPGIPSRGSSNLYNPNIVSASSSPFAPPFSPIPSLLHSNFGNAGPGGVVYPMNANDFPRFQSPLLTPKPPFAPAIGEDENSTFLIGSRPPVSEDNQAQHNFNQAPQFQLEPSLPLHPAPSKKDRNTDYTHTAN